VARYDHTLAVSHHHLLLLLLLLLMLPHMAADNSATASAEARRHSGVLVHGAVAAIAERWMDLLLLLCCLFDLGDLSHDLLKLCRALGLLLRQLSDPVLEFSRIICRHVGLVWIVRRKNHVGCTWTKQSINY
jgi:hypothetical protein